MITTEYIVNYVIASIPAFSALICLTMFLYSERINTNNKNRELRISLTGYFVTLFFNWFSLASFTIFNDLLIFVYPLRYASLLLTPIFFYRFIYLITRLPGNKPFPRWHYSLPVILLLVAIFWPFLLGSGPEAYSLNKYPWLNLFIISHYKVRFAYDIIYITLSLIRIRKYRNEIGNYASQLQESYMGWLNILIIFVIILSLGPALASLSNDIARSQWAFVPVTLLVVQLIIITYNCLIHNFIILEDIPEDTSLETIDKYDKPIKTIERKEFEKLLSEQKPFLNKDLKLSDLAKQVNTNRTYLSVFINTTYGMNFSTLINEKRLHYLENLRKNPAMKNKKNIELIYISGFGSYQSYLRIKEKQTERSILKV